MNGDGPLSSNNGYTNNYNMGGAGSGYGSGKSGFGVTHDAPDNDLSKVLSSVHLIT